MVLKLVEGLPETGLHIGDNSIDALRLGHAMALISGLWNFRSLYGLGREYWAIQGFFVGGITVVRQLQPGTLHLDMFVKSCRGLSEMSDRWPLATSFLSSLKSLVSLHGILLPPHASRYLDSVRIVDSAQAYTAAIKISSSLRRPEVDFAVKGTDTRGLDFTFADLILERDGAEMDGDMQIDN